MTPEEIETTVQQQKYSMDKLVEINKNIGNLTLSPDLFWEFIDRSYIRQFAFKNTICPGEKIFFPAFGRGIMVFLNWELEPYTFVIGYGRLEPLD